MHLGRVGATLFVGTLRDFLIVYVIEISEYTLVAIRLSTSNFQSLNELSFFGLALVCLFVLGVLRPTQQRGHVQPAVNSGTVPEQA